ncbi:sigma-70 region 4 domain-containing protein [Rhodococcus rhodochrous]|uniref:sigma factor-like helix-turn-helix DNA-binding protein n=1 Tax=Rhodococcus qingshengii TaxID=334542 RepID=UPI0022A9D1CD|nr:sigma factor-like helix-turn-helix DNA-binding protein [Rhodococcus qingshengii]MCQ4136658.1 sigma-70 region 4 domain-containing protein [Rhodococcus rhodochrous]
MAKRGPQGGPPLAKRVETQKRRNEALEMRLAGKSNLEIAAYFGVDPGTASRYVTQALKAIPQENAEEVLRQELQRLDRMWLGIWKDAINGQDFKIDRALAIMDRRAKYLGLDNFVQPDNSQDARAALASFLGDVKKQVNGESADEDEDLEDGTDEDEEDDWDNEEAD